MSDLVADLVSRLLDDGDVEQQLDIFARPRQDAGTIHRVDVGLHEAMRGPAVEQTRPRLERLRGARASLDGAAQGLVRRIVERAHHTGDVDERRALDRPLTERTAGLTFEVDERDVTATHED